MAPATDRGPEGVAPGESWWRGAAVALCGLVLTALVWWVLDAREADALAELVDSHALAARTEIEAGIRTRGQALERMARRWEVRGGTPEREWRADALGHVAMFPGVLHVDRVDEDGRVRWVVPGQAFASVVGRDLMLDARRAAVVREARRSGSVASSPALTLSDGRPGFFMLVPVNAGNRPDGFLRMVLDSEALLAQLLEPRVAQGFAVVVNDGEHRVFGDRDSVYAGAASAEQFVRAYDLQWGLRLLPTRALVARTGTGLPRAALIGGCVLSMLLGVTVHLHRMARRRRRELVVRERRQSDSERKYQSLLESMSDGVFVARDGRFAYVNPALPPLLACTERDLRGSAVAAFVDGAPLPSSDAIDAPASPMPLEVRVRRHDGCVRWMELTLRPTTFGDEPAVLGILRDVDARVAAEAAEQAGRERAELVAGGIVDGVWDVDFATGTVYHSERTWSLMGLAPTALPPTFDGWIERVHPDDRDGVTGALRRHLEQREPYAVDYRFLTGRGEYRWFRATGRARWDEHGKPVRMAGSVTDVTEQRIAELALAESEARFRAAMDYSAIGIALVSLDGHWLRVNRALCEIVGYTGDELFGLTFQDITHPDDLATDLGFVEALLAGGIPSYRMEKRYIRKDRTVVWVLLAVALARKADGSPDYFISQIEDIDTRRRAEQAREASEARFRAVAETATDAIVTVDREGTVVFANPAVKRVFGHAPEWLTGRSVDVLFPEGTPDVPGIRFDDLVRRTHLESADRTTEVTGRRATGETFPIELSVASWVVGDERHFTAIMRDVTERHAQERLLIGAIHERETLLREVYHRVKNNLQVIQSLLSLQSRVLPETDVIARDAFADTITRVRAMALVHEKLYQSGNLAGVGAAEYLGDLLRYIAASVASDQRRIRLVTDIDDLPLDLDSAIPLGLLLNELVNNSLKHAFPDQHPGEIRVTLKREGERARLTVSDDGIGLSDAGGAVGAMSSMGTRLAAALARQLGGTIEWQRPAGGGTAAVALIAQAPGNA